MTNLYPGRSSYKLLKILGEGGGSDVHIYLYQQCRNITRRNGDLFGSDAVQQGLAFRRKLYYLKYWFLIGQ